MSGSTRVHFTFWEVKLFHVRFVTNNISLHYRSTSKLDAYNMSMGNSKFNASEAVHCYFPDFFSAQNMVRVIEGKIIQK